MDRTHFCSIYLLTPKFHLQKCHNRHMNMDQLIPCRSATLIVGTSLGVVLRPVHFNNSCQENTFTHPATHADSTKIPLFQTLPKIRAKQANFLRTMYWHPVSSNNADEFQVVQLLWAPNHFLLNHFLCHFRMIHRNQSMAELGAKFSLWPWKPVPPSSQHSITTLLGITWMIRDQLRLMLCRNVETVRQLAPFLVDAVSQLV